MTASFFLYLVQVLAPPAQANVQKISIIASPIGRDRLASDILDTEFRIRPSVDSTNIEQILRNQEFHLLERKGTLCIYADSIIPEFGTRLRALYCYKALSTLAPFKATSIRSLPPRTRDAILSFINSSALLVPDEGDPHIMLELRMTYQVEGTNVQGSLPLGKGVYNPATGDIFDNQSHANMNTLLESPFLSKSHPKFCSRVATVQPMGPFPVAPIFIQFDLPDQVRIAPRLSQATVNKWSADVYLKRIFELSEECNQELDKLKLRLANSLAAEQYGVKENFSYKFNEIPELLQKSMRAGVLNGMRTNDDAVQEANILRSIRVSFHIEADISYAVDSGNKPYVRAHVLRGGSSVTPP